MQSISRLFRAKRAALLGMLLVVSSLSPTFAQSGVPDVEEEGVTLRQALQAERQRRQAVLAEAEALLQQRSGYLAEDTPILGTIFYSMGEPNFFSSDDEVIIDVGANHNMKVGDRLTVFRILAPVPERDSSNAVRRRIQILGEAITERVLETIAVIRLTQASYVIELGDYVQRVGMLPPTVIAPPPSPLATALSSQRPSAAIVSAKDEKQILAQGDIVYLNQGGESGVRVNDRLWIFDHVDSVHHPKSQEWLTPPQKPIGTLRVVDVQKTSATAIVMKSRHEFAVGARAEYIPSFGETEHDRSRPDLEQVAALRPPMTQAPGFAGQSSPCLEQARQQIAAAEAAGVNPQALAIARNTLAYAMSTYQQAQQLKAVGKDAEAAALLETAQDDCLTAQQLVQQVNHRMAKNSTPSSDGYVVQRGNTLWDISALPTVYKDPFLWPLLYRANKEQVNDPDLIYPDQRLTVPRDYSQEEAEVASRRARTRGPWRLDDGPDVYVLEGIRR
jgi:nucleoid-associated protein YgaU